MIFPTNSSLPATLCKAIYCEQTYHSTDFFLSVNLFQGFLLFLVKKSQIGFYWCIWRLCFGGVKYFLSIWVA